MKPYLVACFVLLVLCGCAAPSGAIPTGMVITSTPASTPIPRPAAVQPDPVACKAPVISPTLPATIPGYTQLDPSTGLHMTGTFQEISLADYHLKISGLVDNPLSLSYDELRCLPKMTAKPVLICRGYFEDVATWSGVPLSYLLGLAGVQKSARELILVSADGYAAYLSMQDALREDNFLAYEWEGQPLPILHGFPVRAVLPSQQGSAWVKWLVEIRIQ
jgi:DMSO/TMAO reductase YedYZ molybdopterin-dependent catalytic subunit